MAARPSCSAALLGIFCGPRRKNDPVFGSGTPCSARLCRCRGLGDSVSSSDVPESRGGGGLLAARRHPGRTRFRGDFAKSASRPSFTPSRSVRSPQISHDNPRDRQYRRRPAYGVDRHASSSRFCHDPSRVVAGRPRSTSASIGRSRAGCRRSREFGGIVDPRDGARTPGPPGISPPQRALHGRRAPRPRRNWRRGVHGLHVCPTAQSTFRAEAGARLRLTMAAASPAERRRGARRRRPESKK